MAYKKKTLTQEGEVDTGEKETSSEELNEYVSQPIFSGDMVVEESYDDNPDDNNEVVVDSFIISETSEVIAPDNETDTVNEDDFTPPLQEETDAIQDGQNAQGEADSTEDDNADETADEAADATASDAPNTDEALSDSDSPKEDATEADEEESTESAAARLVAEEGSISYSEYSVSVSETEDGETEDEDNDDDKLQPETEPFSYVRERTEGDDFTDMKKEKKNNSKTVVIVIIALILVILAIVGIFVFRVQKYNKEIALANSYREQENADDAIIHYEKALSAMANSADAYLGLAESYIDKGELEKSIETLNEGIDKTGSENLEASRSVILDQIFATYVLSDYNLNLLPGDTATLSVINRAQDLGFEVKYRSDDENIASITQDGVITANNQGNVTLYANVGNDKYGYRDMNCELTVGVIVTYLEEQGCNYVHKGESGYAPAYVFQADEYGLLKEGGNLLIKQNDADYKVESVTVSDPDVNGDVTYNIVATVTVNKEFGIVLDTYEAEHEWYYDWTSEKFRIGDENTGKMFAVQDLYGEELPVIDSEVAYDDFTYHITGTMDESWEDKDNWKCYFDNDGNTWAKAGGIGTFIFTVKAPKEYRGLVLTVDKAGITEYVGYGTLSDYDSMEIDEEAEDNSAYIDINLFDAAEDGTVKSGSDFYVFRLDDYIE